MTLAALALAAVLAIVVVLFVARPFLRSPDGEQRRPAPGHEELERLARLERRDRALAALKELEFDHRTGKISDADYAEMVTALRQEAAAALVALDPQQTVSVAASAQPAVEDPHPRG